MLLKCCFKLHSERTFIYFILFIRAHKFVIICRWLNFDKSESASIDVVAWVIVRALREVVWEVCTAFKQLIFDWLRNSHSHQFVDHAHILIGQILLYLCECKFLRCTSVSQFKKSCVSWWKLSFVLSKLQSQLLCFLLELFKMNLQAIFKRVIELGSHFFFLSL